MIQALVFDLDDTLYPEKDFVLSGYSAVARFLADSHRCNFNTAFSHMAETYAMRGKDQVFPSVLENLPNLTLTVADLVEVYRAHNPCIGLFPGYSDLIRTLAAQYRLGLITDGLPSVQAKKVSALGLESIMDKVIYTWEYGAEKEKPHPFSFALMLEDLHVDPESALYVGDNPDKDCRGAHGVGMRFAHIQGLEKNHVHTGSGGHEAPEFTIETLFQLPHILRDLN